MQSEETDPPGGLYRTLEMDCDEFLILYKDIDKGWSLVDGKSDSEKREVQDRIEDLIVDRYPTVSTKKRDEGKTWRKWPKKRGISNEVFEARIAQYQGDSKRNFTGEFGVFSRSEAEDMGRGALTSLFIATSFL
jgi:hypothetical protein